MTKKKKTRDEYRKEVREIIQELNSEELIKEFNKIQSLDQLQHIIETYNGTSTVTRNLIQLSVIGDELINRKYKHIEFTYWIKDLEEENLLEVVDKNFENLKKSMNLLFREFFETKIYSIKERKPK